MNECPALFLLGSIIPKRHKKTTPPAVARGVLLDDSTA
nr:MAG TPA: hypothetical protein [Caudoviricetes sp.]